MRRVDPLEKRVYEKYPLTKKEKTGCLLEKNRMNGLREQYRKRLIEEGKEKREY